ncbi:MAG: hypothetical protein WBP58_17955 [Chitinophagaceae bacterium]
MKKRLLLGLLVVCFACEKDESADGNNNIALKDALNGNEWKITSIILTTSDGGFANIFDLNFQPCEKDDLLKFNTNKVFTKSDNINICNPEGNSVFNNLNGGSWDSQASDSTLVIAKGFNAQVYKVSAWSANTMTWKQSSKDYLGIENTLTFTLIR